MIGGGELYIRWQQSGFFFCDFQNVTDILNNIISWLSRNALFIETLCAAHNNKISFLQDFPWNWCIFGKANVGTYLYEYQIKLLEPNFCLRNAIQVLVLHMIPSL